MALDKLVDSTQLDADLTTVANAIRTKGGTSAQLAFPQGMADAIAAIPSGGDAWTLLGVSAVNTIDAFMRAHPIPIEQNGFKMLLIKITGTTAQGGGSGTVLQYLFPFINGTPTWYDSAHTKLQNFAYSLSGRIAPDDISAEGTWATRSNDTHTIVDGELHWTTQQTYYMGIGNSIYYKWVDWR